MAIIPIPNLYYICTLAYLGNAFMFIQYRACYICPGLIFRYESYGGVYFWIGLTKKGNFLVLYVPNTVFQYEFNRSGHYVIWGPFLSHHMIWVCSGTIFQCEFNCSGHYIIWGPFRHHFSIQIQPWWSLCNAGTIFATSYDMGMFRHYFSMWIQL